MHPGASTVTESTVTVLSLPPEVCCEGFSAATLWTREDLVMTALIQPRRYNPQFFTCSGDPPLNSQPSCVGLRGIAWDCVDSCQATLFAQWRL